MTFSSRAALLGVLLTVVPLFLHTKGDCQTDIGDSNAFQTFQDAIKWSSTLDPSAIPQMYLDLGGDIFACMGTAICNGETEDFTDNTNCLPSSCTSADPETLSSVVAWMEALDDAVECTGNFTYEAIREGIPSSLQCRLDMSTDSNIAAFFVALDDIFGTSNDLMLPYFCEGLGGDYNFFTYAAATKTCTGDFLSGVDDELCLPSSCTGNSALHGSGNDYQGT